MIDIQPLESKHWDQVQDLINKHKGPNPETITYKEWSEQPHCHMHIALDGDTVVGMITHMIEINPRGGKVLHISDLLVAKGYGYSKGLGQMSDITTRLLDTGTALAHKHKCYKQHANCSKVHAKLYKKWGLEVVGVNVMRMTNPNSSK